MPDLDLSAVKRRGLSVLRLSAADWYELRGTRSGGTKFTSVFPHDIARAVRAKMPAILLIEGGKVTTDGIFESDEEIISQIKVAWINSIQPISTLQSRVSFDYVTPVAPDTLQNLIGDDVPSRHKAAAKRLLHSKDDLEEVSPKFGEWLMERLAANEENHGAFRRMTMLIAPPRQFRDGAALEQDAIGLALKAFGAPNAEATTLALSGRATALAAARLHEDIVIEHDARWIPGWTLDSSDVTGRAVFTQGNDELQVLTANKQPLEELFGVDLIYLNETRRSIVMVQYKMMEPVKPINKLAKTRIKTPQGTFEQSDEKEWIVQIDDQFRNEMARMAVFDKSASISNVYRMYPSPFFIKLVRRYGSTGGAGILLSLRHLQHLIDGGQLTGPRGGLRIAYNELNGHYLRGETFVDLVRSGYIGSHSATTAHLETLIAATLAEGRGIVAAIQRTLPIVP